MKPEVEFEGRKVRSYGSREPEWGRQMQATEVLELLRQNAEPRLPGEWAKVNPREAYRELVADLGVADFGNILRQLKDKGYYKRIDDLHGEVKMDDRYIGQPKA